jgi:hypothetical protein
LALRISFPKTENCSCPTFFSELYTSFLHKCCLLCVNYQRCHCVVFIRTKL